MEEMNRDELIERLEELQPEFEKVMRQFGAHEPDWEPLKLVFGPFMFMGYSDGIRMYKHQYTRRYLQLDEHGAAYQWLGKKKGYKQIPLERAIMFAFEDAEELMRWLRPSEQEQVETFGDLEPSGELPPGDATYTFTKHEADPDLPG